MIARWRRRPAAAVPVVAPAHRLAYRLQNGRFRETPADGQTLTTVLHLPAAPFWVRLMFANDRAEPWKVVRARIATTAAFDPQSWAPLDATGRADETLWRAVHFDAGGVDREPLPHHAGQTAALTLPPGNPHGAPALAFSDWVPLAPLARIDGGSGALLLVSTTAAGRLRYSEGVGLPDPAIGLLHATLLSDGEGALRGAGHRLDGAHACYGVNFLSAVVGATVVGIGDSIMHSSCTTGEVSGFGLRACVRLTSPRFPVGYVSQGFPGRNTAGFCAAGMQDIAAIRPQVALVQCWSQNEAWTQESADDGFARALAVADATRRAGGVPILVTPAPVFAEHPAAEPFRRASLARVRAAAAQGVRILDLDALWGTGADPNAYQPRWDCGDHTHPNDAACAEAARVLAPMLAEILGL